MGCDIHAYVEYVAFTARDGEPYWDCIMQNLGHRDYNFFSVLSDCGRGEFRPLFEPRGLPEGRLSHVVEREMWLTAVDDKELAEESGYCTPEQAKEWSKHGHSYRKLEIGTNEDGTPRYREQVMHPDLHSHTWLTGDAGQVIAWWITSSCSDYPYGVEWDAAFAAMRALEERGHKTRVVIAFDN